MYNETNAHRSFYTNKFNSSIRRNLISCEYLFFIAFMCKISTSKTVIPITKVPFFIDILRSKNRKIENAFQYCQMSKYDKHNRQVDVPPRRCRDINNVTSADDS